ncbi:hypothetical protein JOL62DRAFT_180871 [Phyllosticta paracitricarpa]|uniref:Uncharacterized protein n=1 Tax=Phyllosticta paracitricarpa TaxID=2016321 RepID=A0ABR1N208_9PEZI
MILPRCAAKRLQQATATPLPLPFHDVASTSAIINLDNKAPHSQLFSGGDAMSLASQAMASRDGLVVPFTSQSALVSCPSLSHTWQTSEANRQQRHRRHSLSPPSSTTSFEYMPPGSRDFQQMLTTFCNKSITDLLPPETSLTDPEQNQCDSRQGRRSTSPATEFSPVTFECQDVVGQMLPPNKTTKTYSRKKKNASVSDRSHEESHSGDEASNEARGAPTLKRKRPAAKPTKRRLPTTRQLTLIPSSVFQETDTDPDADDEHLTPTNDPIEDAHSTAREKPLGACGANKAKARKMTLTLLEKQFRPSKPTKLTADLSAFKIPKAQQKSAISVGDGFAPSEMSLPAKTKRPRRDRRLYFQGARTLKIVAGPLPAPHPLEANGARQSCNPMTIQPRQIFSAESDGPFNTPTTSERLQPSPTPSQHSRELNQKFMTASLLPRTQREVNDRTKSDYQHDKMSMGSPSPGPYYEDAQSREYEERYAEIMGIVPEDDHEFSDVENMQPQSVANKSIGRNENERNEMLAESDTQQEPEDVLFNHLDSSCPGQKARMESSGLWMEVNEDIEGSPTAPNRRLGDESQLFGRNGQQHRSASNERPAYVDPIELDFRTSSRALKGGQPNNWETHSDSTGPKAAFSSHGNHIPPVKKSPAWQKEHKAKSPDPMGTRRRSRYAHPLVVPRHRVFREDAQVSDDRKAKDGFGSDLEGAIRKPSHDVGAEFRYSTRLPSLSFNPPFLR